MGFAGNTCSFTRFRILDPVPDDLILNISDKLKQFSFRDIDDIPELRSFGWVCLDDMLDSQWLAAPPQKGAYIVFSLRLDTRRIPPGVVKKHFTLALRKEKSQLQEDGKTFISRDRKKEIKEQVLLELRQRFLPVPAEINVIWNLGNHQVWFASVQSKMVELFMELFLNTFELHLEELSPFNLACSLLPENQAAILEEIEETRFINSTAEI